MQAQVIKPVDTCETCQSQFKEMKSLYGMYKACPGDPGAKGILEASVEAYNQHHKDAHPVHPDAVKPSQEAAVFAQGLLREFPGIRVFGVVNEQDKACIDDGLIIAYNDRIVSVDVKKGEVEDHGLFLPALSTMTLEEYCIELWEEYFGVVEAN